MAIGLLRVGFWMVDKLLASLCVGLWFAVGFAVVCLLCVGLFMLVLVCLF